MDTCGQHLDTLRMLEKLTYQGVGHLDTSGHLFHYLLQKIFHEEENPENTVQRCPSVQEVIYFNGRWGIGLGA